jgi:hypothetical protein
LKKYPSGDRTKSAGTIKYGKISEWYMRDDQHSFMRLLGQLPARLTAEQAAWVLNCQPHDVTALISARLLKPLGNPAANSIKYFATADLLELIKDRNWLVRVTTTINQHWHKKNVQTRNHLAPPAVAGQCK